MCPYNNYMLSTAGSVSELSSLHDGDVDFRQTYRQVPKKVLPPISDLSNDPQIQTVSTAHRLRPTQYQRNRNEEQPDSRYNFNVCYGLKFILKFRVLVTNSSEHFYAGGTAAPSTYPGKPLTAEDARDLWMN